MADGRPCSCPVAQPRNFHCSSSVLLTSLYTAFHVLTCFLGFFGSDCSCIRHLLRVFQVFNITTPLHSTQHFMYLRVFKGFLVLIFLAYGTYYVFFRFLTLQHHCIVHNISCTY